ncbi:MAG: glycosyltransferase, partial [Lacisediminihabitans sp.]
MSAIGVTEIARALEETPTLESVWLALAVLARALPTEAAVRAAHRRLRSSSALDLVKSAIALGSSGSRRHRSVELLHDAVIVDVRHTAETDLATGIQRVARETVRRWSAWHELTLVTWIDDGTAMRRLTDAERSTALHGTPPLHGSTRKSDMKIVVPVGGTYLLPELAAEVWRTERVSALAQLGHIRSGVIGFDCVPITTAETTGDGMPGAFSRNLGAVAHMSKVGTISDAAATEYRGWRDMLGAAGKSGPDIQSVVLAAEARDATVADQEEFASLAELDELPLILVVGSHEPRKNHMAVLYAAELLWREGLNFRLVFVGGNSWNSMDFLDSIARLRDEGRAIDALSSLPDNLLWAAYRLARFTVFPSINEGFGLPIAESLSCGTPVVTSNYGSMREIGEGHGALLVDPRDDRQIVFG